MLRFKEKVVIVLLVVCLLSLFVQIYFLNYLTGFVQVSQTITWLGMTVNPKNVSIDGKINADKKSVDLNWTGLTSPPEYNIYYNIYYSSDLQEIIKLNLSNVSPNVSIFPHINVSNFTDYTADLVQKRYYTVSYVIYDIEQLSNDTPIGKFTYYYTAPVSSVYGPLASNRINIFLNKSYNAESFLQEIPASLNPTISKLEKSDGAGEYFTTHFRGLQDGHNFNLEISKSYQVSVDQDYNHTIVGDIYLPPYTLEYSVLNSSLFGILASQWYGIFDTKKNYYAESFLQEIPANRSPTISRLDKSDAAGEYLTTHVQGINDGNNFSLSAGTGYIITVNDDYTHTLCSSISSCFT